MSTVASSVARLGAVSLVLVAMLAAVPAAQRATLVVSPASLAAGLTDPNLVILHLGSRADYDKAHIPGARYTSLNELSAPRVEGGLTLQMQPAEALRATLASLGISDSSRIVVVFSGTFITAATRAMFTLDYAGLGDRIAMLDGGMNAWTAGGHPVTTEVPPVTPGTLSPLTLRPTVVDADQVVQALRAPGTAVVDARTTAFYSGVQTGGGQATPHKTGHIDGALSVPFSSLAAEDGTWKSAEDLRAIFTSAGVKPGDTVVAYCHIGQQATAVIFAARTLGFDVRLYDGSFEDWSRKDLPVKKDREPNAIDAPISRP